MATMIPDGWMIRSAVAGGLLLLAGAIAMRMVRQPGRRQRVGEFALLCSLLVGGLCALPGWLSFSLPFPAASGDKSPETSTAPDPNLEGLENLLAAAALGEAVKPASGSDSVGIDVGELVPKAGGLLGDIWLESLEEVPAAEPTNWGAVLLGAYVGLVLLLLAYCLTGYLGLYRLCRDSQPPSGRVERLFAGLTRDRACRPRLRVSDRIATPVSFGILRPTILLPPDFCTRQTEEELRLVLVHELTHLKRRDGWSCLLSAIGQAFYFYVPWFWWLRRQVRLCQEYMADAAAAAMTTSEDYAEYLVSLTTLGPQRLPAGARVSGVRGTSSDLYRRITMLVNGSQRVEARCPRWWLLAAGGGFLALAVLLSGIRLEARANDDQPGKADPETAFQAAHLAEILTLLEDDDDDDKKKKETKVRLKLADDKAAQEPDSKARQKAIEEVKSALEKAREAAAKSKLDEAEGQLKQAMIQLQKAKADLEAARVQTELHRIFKQKEEETAAKVFARKQLGEAVKDLTKASVDDSVLDAVKQALKAAQLDADKKAEIIRQVEKSLKAGHAAQDAANLAAARAGYSFSRAIATGASGGGRLGIQISTPDEALASQLDLPKGQGLLIVQVQPESAAAKAGFQKHDIVVRFQGKDVSSNPADFAKAVAGAKPDTKAEAVVLRHGKKVNVTVTMPEASKETPRSRLYVPATPEKVPGVILKPQTDLKLAPMFLQGKSVDLMDAGKLAQGLRPLTAVRYNPDGGTQKSVAISVIRNNDEFKCQRTEGDQEITVSGSIDDGKAKVAKISVKTGKNEDTFADPSKVKGDIREKVEQLIEMVEKGKVEVKSGKPAK